MSGKKIVAVRAVEGKIQFFPILLFLTTLLSQSLNVLPARNDNEGADSNLSSDASSSVFPVSPSESQATVRLQKGFLHSVKKTMQKAAAVISLAPSTSSSSSPPQIPRTTTTCRMSTRVLRPSSKRTKV
ncbi:MAG: hypothetical protein J3R72DRAFT_457711, partial [Linnemannia gamsii]